MLRDLDESRRRTLRNEYLFEIAAANTKTLLRFAHVYLAGAERLFRLQTDAARSVYEDYSHRLKALASRPDGAEAWKDLPNLYRFDPDKGRELVQAYLDTVTETQTEFLDLVREEFTSYAEGIKHNVEEFAKAVSQEGPLVSVVRAVTEEVTQEHEETRAGKRKQAA